MIWNGVLHGVAAVLTVLSAILVAVNVSARLTTAGFIVFVFASISWIEAAARRKAHSNKMGSKQPAVISPLCLEAVQRIDKLFDIERDINGCPTYQRHDMRQEFSAPLVADLHAWMREQRGKLSGANDVAKAMDYMLKRWAVFARFLDDGRICHCICMLKIKFPQRQEASDPTVCQSPHSASSLRV